MKPLETITFLALLRFLFAASETQERLGYFPQDDIREFYNTTTLIRTLTGAHPSGNGMKACKIDDVMYNTWMDVDFERTSNDGWEKNETAHLKGVYIDQHYRYQPTWMQITTSDNGDAFSERMVYANKKKTCGIILTFKEIPQGQTYFHNKYLKYQVCELRYRDTHVGKPYKECLDAFENICIGKQKGEVEEIDCTENEEKFNF